MTESTTGLRRRGEALRTAVLAATLAEIAERGLDGASVAAIADRAEVHETSIYRRWGTREHLLTEALLRSSADQIPTPDTGTIRGDLIALAGALAAYLGTPLGRALVRSMAQAGDAEFVAAHQTFWVGRFVALEPVIARAVTRGEIRADVDPALVLEAVVAPINMRVLLTREPLDGTLPEQLADLVLAGIARR